MTFEKSVEIAAPAERVWSVIRDVERWHEWTATVRSVERLDPGAPLGVGARVRIRQPRLPRAIWRVTEMTEGGGFVWVTSGAGVRVTARHSVEPVPGGTRARLSVEFSGPFGSLAGWLTRRLNVRYLGIEANGLKRRSEA
jgi:uncharacterized membrane protein